MEQPPRPAVPVPHGLAPAFDAYRRLASEAVRGLAQALRRQADEADDLARPVAGYVQQAAAMLDRSAERLGQLDLQRLRSGVEGAIRRNPGASVAVAVVAGFAVGALMRRR